MINCIITGATKGIGKACAAIFAKNNCTLFLCSRNLNDLNETKKELLKINSSIQIFTFVCDVSKKDQIQAFSNYILNQTQTIDVLINNAGIFIPGNLSDEPDGLLEQLIETNLYSAYYLSRKLIPAMKAKKKGHIFNLCSVASINAYDAGGSYAISKFALYGFSKNLRHELKQFGIKVTAVLPGATFTPSWNGIEIPEERFIDVNDLAHLIWNAYEVSPRTVVEEILIRPMEGDL